MGLLDPHGAGDMSKLKEMTEEEAAEKERQKSRSYYWAHREERLKYSKERRKTHLKQIRARELTRYHEHADEINANKRAKRRL